MLPRTLFALLFFTAVAETILHGVHALAQTAVRREALLGVRAQITAATNAARETVAKAVISGSDPRRLNIQSLQIGGCRLFSYGACSIAGKAKVRFAVPASSSPCPDAACTVYEQGNDSVLEGRIGATISAEATGPDNAVLASRTESVIFRTMRVSPYAVLAGESDGTGVASGAPGDDAGAAPAGTAPGTLVNVIYRNAVTGAEMPADVWQAAAESRDGEPAWKP